MVVLYVFSLLKTSCNFSAFILLPSYFVIFNIISVNSFSGFWSLLHLVLLVFSLVISSANSFSVGDQIWRAELIILLIYVYQFIKVSCLFYFVLYHFIVLFLSLSPNFNTSSPSYEESLKYHFCIFLQSTFHKVTLNLKKNHVLDFVIIHVRIYRNIIVLHFWFYIFLLNIVLWRLNSYIGKSWSHDNISLNFPLVRDLLLLNPFIS